jgi:hypothetical protein
MMHCFFAQTLILACVFSSVGKNDKPPHRSIGKCADVSYFVLDEMLPGTTFLIADGR